MPKKNWTPEERKAFGDKMRASRNKNKNLQTETPEPVEQVEPVAPESNPDVPKVQMGEQSVEDLLRQVQELRDFQWRYMMGQQAPQDAQVAGGKMVGTFEKYKTDPALYPNPCTRLSEESKLQRFAFPINYELDFQVSESSYTTIDNVRTKEPKFKLELIRKVLDENTGEDTGGRYAVCQLIMHEDPDTALIIASQQGIEVDENDERSFLNEMRYIRMRDWLVDCFYPPAVEDTRTRRDVVIDGKLVQYWEVTGESGKGVRKQDWDAVPKVKF